MKKIIYLLLTQILILLIGTFLQQKGFIELQQFYAYTIAPVACITALVIRDLYKINKEQS